MHCGTSDTPQYFHIQTKKIQRCQWSLETVNFLFGHAMIGGYSDSTSRNDNFTNFSCMEHQGSWNLVVFLVSLTLLLGTGFLSQLLY